MCGYNICNGNCGVILWQNNLWVKNGYDKKEKSMSELKPDSEKKEERLSDKEKVFRRKRKRRKLTTIIRISWMEDSVPSRTRWFWFQQKSQFSP